MHLYSFPPAHPHAFSCLLIKTVRVFLNCHNGLLHKTSSLSRERMVWTWLCWLDMSHMHTNLQYTCIRACSLTPLPPAPISLRGTSLLSAPDRIQAFLTSPRTVTSERTNSWTTTRRHGGSPSSVLASLPSQKWPRKRAGRLAGTPWPRARRLDSDVAA